MSRSGRLERLRASFDSHGLDGLLVSQPESRYYLSGYNGHDLPPRDSAGYLLITRDKALLLTDPRTTGQARDEADGFEVVTYTSSASGPDVIAQTLCQLGAPRVGFESIHLPYGIWDEIQRDLPSATVLVPVDRVVDDLRVVKDAEELACLQE